MKYGIVICGATFIKIHVEGVEFYSFMVNWCYISGENSNI